MTGIPAAVSSVSVIKGKRYYVTERYDRHQADGRVQRYHQEDFCQAMGVEAERKYQVDGGPSASRCFRFLREHSFRLADQMRFVDYYLYNFLIGNADAHAKNFSLLCVGDKPVVAPIYDAMSTLVYPQIYNSMAMEIGGRYEFKDVSRESFELFARECDINPKAVYSRLDALAATLPQNAMELKERMSDEGTPSPIYDKIVAVIERHISQTVRVFDSF